MYFRNFLKLNRATRQTSFQWKHKAWGRQSSHLASLAASISEATERLEQYLTANGLPHPGFEVDSPLSFPKLPEDMKQAREVIMQATKELGDLVTGPREGMRWMAWNHNDSLSLHAVFHYNIAKSFPLHGTATYAEISQTVGLDEVNARRLIRHAMTNRIFKEVSPGVVAHTAASRILAQDQPMIDWVGLCVEDLWPAAVQTVSALKSYPSASEPTQTGFCLANGTEDRESMFATLGRSPLRAKRFGGAMASLTGGEGYEVSYLRDNYDWESIDKAGGTVVDIGGSHGFICVDLAKRWKNIRFVVQDLPQTIASAPDLGELNDRITFQTHDFHTKQPVKGADVYLYRGVMHNHSAPYAISMLRQLIPALKKGARIVINDGCLQTPGTELPHNERVMRTMDLIMLTMLNAQERTEEEFKQLFEATDARFSFRGFSKPKGSRMSVVEAVWDGQDFENAV